MCHKFMAHGSIWFSDGARGPFIQDYVNHQNGQYSKKRRLCGKEGTVHNNTIDGCWGIVKGKFQARRGTYGEHIWENSKEYQWRHNTGDSDPFLCLLKAIWDEFLPD